MPEDVIVEIGLAIAARTLDNPIPGSDLEPTPRTLVSHDGISFRNLKDILLTERLPYCLQSMQELCGNLIDTPA